MSEGDLSQKLDQILSDPARVAQIASLAKSFAAEGTAGSEKRPDLDFGPAPKGGDLTNLIPPEMLRDFREHAGERIALLQAVRPFLEPERRVKVDRVLSVLRTLELLTAVQRRKEG